MNPAECRYFDQKTKQHKNARNSQSLLEGSLRTVFNKLNSLTSFVPEFHLVEAGNIVHHVMTAAGKTRHLIGDEVCV